MNREPSTHPETLPPTTGEIVARAHRLWIEAGRPEGRDREHWQKAERELRAPESKQAPEPARPRCPL